MSITHQHLSPHGVRYVSSDFVLVALFIGILSTVLVLLLAQISINMIGVKHPRKVSGVRKSFVVISI